jgi:hypothetical protein
VAARRRAVGSPLPSPEGPPTVPPLPPTVIPLPPTGGAPPIVGPPKAAPERQKLAAVDFYGALQRVLDAAQRNLSTANNPFADFVVKELKVDAAVQLQVNALGVLLFVPADDSMTPESVSRVSLTLAAVAKTAGDSMPRDLVEADATPLSDLRWLPPFLVNQLAQYEVKTAADFLGLAADARLSTTIVSVLKQDRADLVRWTNQMQLLQLPSMTSQFVDTLDRFEIRGFADLAQMSDDVIAKLPRTAPTLTTQLLILWRDSAKQRLAP